jgi:hypothetical protein
LLKTYSPEELEGLYMNFTVMDKGKVVEIVPNGAN